jgi:hypothetical protein
VTDAFPDNYLLVLTITDKDITPTEVELVVASPSFQATVGEHSLSFSGNIAMAADDRVIVAYQLGWQVPVSTGKGSTQFVASSTQGSVRLKLGEDVQVIRAGTRSARLSIRKLETSKAK